MYLSGAGRAMAYRRRVAFYLVFLFFTCFALASFVFFQFPVISARMEAWRRPFTGIQTGDQRSRSTIDTRSFFSLSGKNLLFLLTSFASSPTILSSSQAQSPVMAVPKERWRRHFTGASTGDLFSGSSLTTRRTISHFEKNSLHSLSMYGLNGTRSCTPKPYSLFMKSNLFPPSFANPIPADLKILPGLNHLISLRVSLESRRNIKQNRVTTLLWSTIPVTIPTPFSISLIEDYLISGSRRHICSGSTNLGQSFHKLMLNWAWPINFESGGFIGPTSLMILRPIGCSSDIFVACPNLENLHLPTRASTVRSEHCRQSRLRPPSRVSFPLVQLSSCRGQERFPSSSLMERTFSHLFLSMRGVFISISLIKKLLDVLTKVMDFVSKSLMWTNLLSVDDYGLNSISFMGVLMLDRFNTSPDHLSNFIKFVSLSLISACSSVLAGLIAFRDCPNMLIYHVI